MAKPDLANSNVVPFLIAGILSGSLSATFLRPGEVTKRSGATPVAAEVEDPTADGHSAWIADLHPVLDALGGALVAPPGESTEQAAARTMATSAAAKRATSDDALAALGRLRRGLDDAESSGTDPCASTRTLAETADTLGGYVLASSDSEGKSARHIAAKGLLDEYRQWRRLSDLTRRVKDSKEQSFAAAYDVNFIIATVPDYVDSNSGWLADQILAAIQASMARNSYVLDRPQLVDWSRSTAKEDGLTSMSRLHERQPGALIFRKVDPVAPKHVQLQVVLLVLETPTAGVHHAALRNAAAFVRTWKQCTGENRRVLRILGPTFSGSTLSLAVTLNEIRQHDKTSFDRTWVVSGSATADSNDGTMAAFAPGVNYRTTVLKSSVLERHMADFLKGMNSSWSGGARVALLKESNTAYGIGSATPPRPEDPFQLARVFKFPLHVAQLWSALPDTAPAPLFAPGPIIPLNMREAAPPSDQIPALRPQLTSAVVGSTVESILDAIRHERLTAVGIVATDDRDALFLAREVKRSTPDAQLFFFGTHALYLHPEYVPYLRGGLVASSYSLALANQPETPAWWPVKVREAFQSMSSEGVFHATRALLTVTDSEEFSLDFCESDPPREPCIRQPRATINVIGEDGYWTLPYVPASTNPGEPPVLVTPAQLPPVPLRALLAALIVIGIAGLHVFMIRLIRGELRAWAEKLRARAEKLQERAKPDSPATAPAASVLEWPIVRMFVPPRTVPGAASNHLRALRICFLLLGLSVAWVVVTTVPFSLGFSVGRAVLTGTLALAALAMTVVPAWRWCGESKELADRIRKGYDNGHDAPSQMTLVAKGIFSIVVLTLVSFAFVTVNTLRLTADPNVGPLVLARYVGGGVVSPAALTLLTLTAIYAALITGVRRLSLVGYGYAGLTAGSAVFSLLTGQKPQKKAKPAQLACILDMPAQNLPGPYLAAVLAVAFVAILCFAQTSSFDGPVYTLFLFVSSLAALSIGLLFLAQGLATWNIARSHISRLGHSPIEAQLASVSSYVPWDISLSPPRLTELMPVARMADGVIREFQQKACSTVLEAGRQARRAVERSSILSVASVSSVSLRTNDLHRFQALLMPPSHVHQLTKEMEERQHAALIQSESWSKMWELSDTIVSAMELTAWQRSGAPASAQSSHSLAIADSAGDLVTVQAHASFVVSEEPKAPRTAPRTEAGWLDRCEQLIALQLAFVLRDIVARTVTCLFAAMLCLTLLTAAHLLYSFNGRNVTLTIDMLAVAATAVVSVWILVDMERNAVLSRLRTTTPGRVDINWDFFKRIAVYGVLPLLIVLASLFPEVGGTLFGWLEPLRKLSSF